MYQLRMYTICISNICICIYHLPHLRPTVQRQTFVLSSHTLIYLFTCNSPWSLFSKASFLFWWDCWGVVPRLSPGPYSGAGQVAPFHRKEGAAPWGVMCCPSVLSSAPCLERWSELQNIASRLQGRLQRAFVIFWCATKHYGWKNTFLKDWKYHKLC